MRRMWLGGGAQFGEREVSVEAGGNDVFAEILDGGELNGKKAEVAGSVDISLFVVDEEGFCGQGAEFIERQTVDGCFGLGHLVLEAPDKNVEAREPIEFALDIGEHGVAHVGKDGGADAMLLEFDLPGKHGGVLRGPHARIQDVEFVDVCGTEVKLRIADEILPELKPRKLALIVSVSIGPVDGFELVTRQAGDADHGVMRIGIRLSGKNHSIIEDDRAQRQETLLKAGGLYCGRDANEYCSGQWSVVSGQWAVGSRQ